jgi:hypothetical protein
VPLWHANTEVIESGGSCTHALIVGVSRYAHLPPRGVPGAQTFGLQQLESAAAGALAFARWLRDDYRNADAPLADIDLLLSPSPLELHEVEGMGAADVATLPATRENVKDALTRWRAASDGNADGTAILYLAGHGVVISPEGALVVGLEDFASSPGAEFDEAVDLQSVRFGMRGATLPRDQFYFADACSFAPRLEPGVALKGGIGLSYGPFCARQRATPVYMGAMPGTLAWGEPGKGTLFSQALIESLELLAVTSDGNGQWNVLDTNLVGGLMGRVAELAREQAVRQVVHPGGALGSVVFHQLEKPPTVALNISVDPDHAGEVCFATLTDGDTELFARLPLAEPIRTPIPAGFYTLNVAIDPATQGYRDRMGVPCPASPPKPAPLNVKVHA